MRNQRLATLVGLGCFALMLLTEPGMAIVWDEGYTLGRVERVRLWLKAMADPTGAAQRWQPPALELVQQQGLPAPTARQVASRWSLLFEPRVIGWFWPFAREEPHGHPPFYALVALIGDLLTPWREPLQRARLGTILFHALAAGVLFNSICKRFGMIPALVSAACWSMALQVFGLGHYATYDGLLNSLWLMGILLTLEAQEASSPKRARLFFAASGVVLGAAMATKLSGWFLVVPLGMSVLFSGFRKSSIVGFIQSCVVAVVALYLFNPPWWCEPIRGPVRFFQSNLSRAQTIPIETLYLGKVYKTPAESLPWSNTIVLSAMTTPVSVLVCSLLGLLLVWKTTPHRRFVQVMAVGWFVPLALRAMPHTPGHDGVRQFVAGLGVSSAMSGVGLAWIMERSQRIAKGVTGLVCLELVASLALIYPVPLSYFSPIAGGLAGASKLGMEPTYYWDALTPDVLKWLNANTKPQEKIAFRGFPTSFLYLNMTGQLKPSVDPRIPGNYQWLVMQNRPGNFEPRDRDVIEKLKPVYSYKKFGVWLVSVYDMNEVGRIWKETSTATTNKP